MTVLLSTLLVDAADFIKSVSLFMPRQSRACYERGSSCLFAFSLWEFSLLMDFIVRSSVLAECAFVTAAAASSEEAARRY